MSGWPGRPIVGTRDVIWLVVAGLCRDGAIFLDLSDGTTSKRAKVLGRWGGSWWWRGGKFYSGLPRLVGFHSRLETPGHHDLSADVSYPRDRDGPFRRSE